MAEDGFGELGDDSDFFSAEPQQAQQSETPFDDPPAAAGGGADDPSRAEADAPAPGTPLRSRLHTSHAPLLTLSYPLLSPLPASLSRSDRVNATPPSGRRAERNLRRRTRH
jgi:hypothetical protein